MIRSVELQEISEDLEKQSAWLKQRVNSALEATQLGMRNLQKAFSEKMRGMDDRRARIAEIPTVAQLDVAYRDTISVTERTQASTNKVCEEVSSCTATFVLSLPSPLFFSFRSLCCFVSKRVTHWRPSKWRGSEYSASRRPKWLEGPTSLRWYVETWRGGPHP